MHHETLHLPLPPCVVEWCPHPAALDLLAVGTYVLDARYLLDEQSQQRNGQLHLYRVQAPAAAAAAEGTEPDDGVGTVPAQQQQQQQQPRLLPCAPPLDLPGIFDLRWHPRSAMPRLAAALADGSVRLLDFQIHEHELPGTGGEGTGSAVTAPDLVPTAAMTLQSGGGGEGDAGGAPVVEQGSMAVSLDFSRSPGSEGDTLVASYSSGQLQLFQATPAGMASLAVWQAHSLEAWAAAADRWHPALLHSGGDDGAYRLWDARQGFAGGAAWQDKRTHRAGVCCVASSPHQPHLACTGSYDDCLRLWDLRSPGRPLMVAEANVGGGVWRAKWHPTHPRLLLAACMYNGFAVMRVDGGGGGGEGPCIELLQAYVHQAGSLSYGADWCRQPPPVPSAAELAAAESGSGSGGALVATCSFYDKQLHLWSPDVREVV